MLNLMPPVSVERRIAQQINIPGAPLYQPLSPRYLNNPLPTPLGSFGQTYETGFDHLPLPWGPPPTALMKGKDDLITRRWPAIAPN